MTEREKEFEFSGEPASALARLERSMRGTAVTSWAVAAVAAVLTYLAFEGRVAGLGVVMILVTIYFAFGGLWMTLAAKEFRQILTTEGQDQTHLLAAVTKLASYYRVKMWVLMILLGLSMLSLTGETLGAGWTL